MALSWHASVLRLRTAIRPTARLFLERLTLLQRESAGTEPRHYRCVGIGVGPANLSLASLMHRHTEISNLFLDRKPAFGWHDGQQIPDATIQVSMLKDLVSL